MTLADLTALLRPLAATIVAIVAAFGTARWVPLGDFSELGARSGLLLIFGVSAQALTIGRLQRLGLCGEVLSLLALVAVFGFGFAKAGREESIAGALALSAAVFSLSFGVGLPLRALRAIGLARVAMLGLFAALCGSLWMVPKDWSPVPEAITIFNPLIRLHSLLPPENFANAIPLYQRLAGRDGYEPRGDEGLLEVAITVAVLLGGTALLRVLPPLLRRDSEGEAPARTGDAPA